MGELKREVSGGKVTGNLLRVRGGDNRGGGGNHRSCIDGHLIYAPPKITHGPQKPSVSINCPRKNCVYSVCNKYPLFVSRPIAIETSQGV